jgi:hypothetical protein
MSEKQTDDQNLSRRMRNTINSKRKQEIADLSIAERLTLRAKELTIIIPFESKSAGIINVEVRLPTLQEYDRISTFKPRFDEAIATGDTEAIRKINDEMYALMASICVDESLNEEFFRSGVMASNDFTQIIKEAVMEHDRRNEDSRSFRDKKSGALSTVHGTRKVPP